MKKIEIVIDDPEVQKLRTKDIVPTFEIQNNDSIYPCDPSVAVDSGKLEFEGYTKTKSFGLLKINVKDDCNWMESIIDFLHGNPIIIDKTNACEIKQLSEALGIPLLVNHSLRVIYSCRVYLDYYDENEEDDFQII